MELPSTYSSAHYEATVNLLPEKLPDFHCPGYGSVDLSHCVLYLVVCYSWRVLSALGTYFCLNISKRLNLVTSIVYYSFGKNPVFYQVLPSLALYLTIKICSLEEYDHHSRPDNSSEEFHHHFRQNFVVS